MSVSRRTLFGMIAAAPLAAKAALAEAAAPSVVAAQLPPGTLVVDGHGYAVTREVFDDFVYGDDVHGAGRYAVNPADWRGLYGSTGT